MAFLREIPKVKDPNDNKQLLNYIYALEEQLRYVYANLGAENLINGAVGADQLQAGSITAEKISAPAMKELQLQSQKAVRILAKETDKKFAEVEVGVDGIRETVKGAEENAYYAVSKAEQALTRVEGMQGQADFVQYDEPVAKEIGDKWTQTAAPPQTWGDLENMTWGDLENKKWGDLNTEYVAHYVWDGKQWLQIVNEEDIAKKLSEIDQKNTKIALRVEEVAEEEPETLRNSKVIISLDGIQLGTSGVFIVDSGNFGIDADGNVTLQGRIVSDSGNIGGWDIAPGNLSSGSGTKHVRLSTEDATYAIWAGAENGENAPFRVTPDGKVYMTKLYVTDENGNAQADPVSLSGSWYRTNRAVQSLSAENNTLTIKLYDGTTVNFKKADGYGYITGLANGNTITIGGYKLNESGQGEIVDSGAITLTLDTENKKVNFSGGAGFKNFTAANGMDVTAMYNTGWNKCIDNCTGANVLVNYYAAGETLYDKDGNEAAGPWYKGTPEYRYTIPSKL